MKMLTRLVAGAMALVLAVAPALAVPQGSPASFNSGTPITPSGATIGQSMSTFFGKVVDPTFDGMKCDGASDNAGALARAVARLPTNGTLYFPPAAQKCLTSTALSVPSGATVYAYPGTVFLAPTATSTANPLLISAAGVSNVVVYGLGFDGGGPTFANANTLATVYNVSNVAFERTTFQNTRGLSLLFSTNVTNSGVRGGRFTNVGNYWKTSAAGADQKQGVAFCCGVTLPTSAAQSGVGTGLTFASTSGVAVGQLVSGNGVQPGSYVTAVTSTSVTLSQNTYAVIPSGANLTFSTNAGNFVTDSYFSDIGLDAVSAANQVGFTSSGNRYVGVGGQYSNGGAADYIASSDKVILRGETVLGAYGNGLDVYRTSNVTIDGNNVDRAGGAGISYSGGSGASITSNVTNNNNQGGTSALVAGIALSGMSGDPAATNVTVATNTATDNQATKTQTYGLQIRTGSNSANIWIDQSNRFFGNSTSDLGQLATSYSAPTSSLGYIAQYGSTPNTGVALLPNGTGGLQIGPHDSTTAGGNPIGKYAVDLGTFRTNAAQVASGDYSSVLYGANNTAAGANSVAGGQWTSTFGPGSRAMGAFAQDRYRAGTDVWASGQTSANGDSQGSSLILRVATTSTTAKRLTSDVSNPGTPSNQNTANLPLINFPTNQEAIYQCSIKAVATDLTSPGNFTSYYEPMATLYRSTTVATTTFVGSGSAITKTVGTAGTFLPSADTTYAGLAITWTAPNNDNWHAVARVDCVEAF